MSSDSESRLLSSRQPLDAWAKRECGARGVSATFPDALRGGLQNNEIKELRNAQTALAGNWSSLATFGFTPIAG